MTTAKYLDEALRRIKTGVYIKYRNKHFVVVDSIGVALSTTDKKLAIRMYLLLTAA